MKINVLLFSSLIAVGNSQTSGTASTTRYWDCSGGACACGYEGDNGQPAHCYSNALFDAPNGNSYGAKYYGTAAVSQGIAQLPDPNNNWLGDYCGKCYKVTGTANIPGATAGTTTLVLKAANFCPSGNAACSGNNPHFDIAAPGFDYAGASLSNSCTTVDPSELDGYSSCGYWQITSEGTANCDCNEFADPVLRAGCENFLSLEWNNPDVSYEEVTCPNELNRLSCGIDENGDWPITKDEPEFCASNLDDSPTAPQAPTTPSPTPGPTPDPTPAPATPSPTPAGGTLCCTWNYDTCEGGPWCNQSQQNCEGPCGGEWIDVTVCDGYQTKWDDCTTLDNCCTGLTCQGSPTSKQCL